MTHALGALTLLACAAALCAQDASHQPPASSQPSADTKPPAGLEADWEIAAVLREMGDHASRLMPLLDKIDVDAWVAKGASDTYAAQLKSSREQASAMAAGARALANNPTQLSAALELFFRIEALDTMLGSLEEGLRKYQSPADAQGLASLAAENGANRERFQRYIVNLAAEREREFQAMDREAQRCRGALTQAPPRAGRKK